MAKATATCKCSKCGAEIDLVKICHSRREADAWEAYIVGQQHTCDICQKSIGLAKAASSSTETEMSYSMYKKDYSQFKTKPGSYNAATKTITVYVPVDHDLAIYICKAHGWPQDAFHLKHAHQLIVDVRAMGKDAAMNTASSNEGRELVNAIFA